MNVFCMSHYASEGYEIWMRRESLDPILGLAVAHGWDPAGTLEPSYWDDHSFYESTPEFRNVAHDWGYRLPGSYRVDGGAFVYEPRAWGGHLRPPQGQVVTQEDAAAMAAALRRAVDSVADYGAHLERVFEAAIADEEEKLRGLECGEPPAWARDHAIRAAVAAHLSEKELLSLISFCAKGHSTCGRATRQKRETGSRRAGPYSQRHQPGSPPPR